MCWFFGGLFFSLFFSLPHDTLIFRKPVPWKGHIDILKEAS